MELTIAELQGQVNELRTKLGAVENVINRVEWPEPERIAYAKILLESFRAPGANGIATWTTLTAPMLKVMTGIKPGRGAQALIKFEKAGLISRERIYTHPGSDFTSYMLTKVPVNVELPERLDDTAREKDARARAAKNQNEMRRLAAMGRELETMTCPKCGTKGALGITCEHCHEALSVAELEMMTAAPDARKSQPLDPPAHYDADTGELIQDAGAQGAKIATKNPVGCEKRNPQADPGATTPLVALNAVRDDLAEPATITANEPELPPAAPYTPGPGEHANPLINAIGAQARYLPCNVIPQVDDKPKKLPAWPGGDGAPAYKDWQNPEHWMMAAAAARYMRAWGFEALSVQLAGPEHDTRCIDFDECLADGRVIIERIAHLVTWLGTYTTESVSGTGLHAWLIDRTGLIPQKLNEDDGIGIYWKSKHICERFKPYGPTLHVRVITDPTQARAICRMLGVIPTDEQVIALPLPAHTPAPGTSDRLAWAGELLNRVAAWRRDDYHEWIRVGMGLREFGAAGLAAWGTWSRGSSKYKPGECEAKWATFDTDVSKPITIGTLYQMAVEDNPR